MPDAPTATASARPVAAPAPSASASATTPPSCEGLPLDPGPLLCDVRRLAGPELRGRRSASDDEGRAAEWLSAALRAADLDARVLPFEVDGKRSRNVIATIAATRPTARGVIVLGAHMDHLGERPEGTYFGADDNASGCAVVLGVARALVSRRGELGRDVVVAFFGAEEIGLLGSREIARRPPFAGPMAAMLNVDMVGRPLSDQPALRAASRLLGIDPRSSVGADVTEGHPELTRVVRESAEGEGHRAVLIEDLPTALQPAVRAMSEGRGDNASFEAVGVPTVFFSSAESADYHRPTDTVETIDPTLLSVRARTVLRATIAISTLATP